jgi:hypothetical protein
MMIFRDKIDEYLNIDLVRDPTFRNIRLVAAMSISRGYVFELRPLMGFLFIHQMIYENEEPRWNDVDRKTEELREKPVPVPQYTVHHEFHMDWLGRKTGLRGERPATSRLSHGTA